MTTTSTTSTARIVKLQRRPSSVYGNPRFRVTLDDGRTLTTEPNSSLAYAIENPDISGSSRDMRENGWLPPLLTVTVNGHGNITHAVPVYPGRHGEMIAAADGTVQA